MGVPSRTLGYTGTHRHGLEQRSEVRPGRRHIGAQVGRGEGPGNQWIARGPGTNEASRTGDLPNGREPGAVDRGPMGCPRTGNQGLPKSRGPWAPYGPGTRGCLRTGSQGLPNGRGPGAL